jgi:hypothetical protein
MNKTFSTMLLCLASTPLFGASYDTLPKGVNMFVFKQVVTSTIESKYDSNHNDNSFALKENFTSGKLENISSAFKSYFEELKALSPDAYNQFSLGEFRADATAKVNAQGLALALGMSDHLTIYGSLPIYHLKSNVSFSQSIKSNLGAIQAAIQNSPTNTPLSAFVRQLTLQLPETNEQLLQSLIVNYYGYKPLGNWEKDAVGDAEIGAMYRLTDFSDRGLAITAGAALPTGKSDDPDSLQDINTGDGQVDAFVESAAGISFYDRFLQLDLKTRFTYQFSSNKSIRTLNDPTIPLSKYKEMMTEKLGNKIDANLMVTINPRIWLNFNASFMYSETGSSEYSATDPKVKAILEQNTAYNNYWGKVGVGLTSLDLYKMKKIDIPCEINLSAQKLLNAKNAADYERFDLDFRLYF